MELGDAGVAHRALADARLTLETFRYYVGRLAPRDLAEIVPTKADCPPDPNTREPRANSKDDTPET